MVKKPNFFWTSYSDLMTSLFFIMMVLFVLTIMMLRNRQKGLITEVERLNKILKLEEQFKPLEENGNFIYLPGCKKFVVKELMAEEIFDPLQTYIKPEFLQKTLDAGIAIEEFLQNLNKSNPDLSYLLVIEGNMANKWDKSINTDNNWGYTQSYKRALAVYNYWNQKGIDFRKYNVEVMLCGSGFNGLCRDDVEENNKRFSIQIIPKVTNN